MCKENILSFILKNKIMEKEEEEEKKKIIF